MQAYRVNRRSLLLGIATAPAIVHAARAAPLTMRLSSSLPNNPKFANGRVYYDNLVKRLGAHGLARIASTCNFFLIISLGKRLMSSILLVLV